MIPRKNLIPLKEEFARIRKEGKIFDSPSFGVLISYNKTLLHAQAAFIVSKKISLKSVVRHEVKRKLTETAGKFLPAIPKNVELVFLAKSKAVEATKEELEKELVGVLRRERLLA